MKIKTSFSDLKNEIIEHPNQGSLLAIYDTLVKLGLEVDVYSVENEKINDINTPFITQYTNGKRPIFVAVKDFSNDKVRFYNDLNKLVVLEIDVFLNRWNGVCLIAKEDSYAASHSKITSNSKPKRINYILLCFLIIISSYFIIQYPLKTFFLSDNTVFFFSYLILNSLGLITCLILLWYEIDKFNPVVKNLCSSSSKSVNCSAVLNSKESRIFGIFSLSELGFSYFFACLSLSITFYNESLLSSILSAITFLTIPGILYSLWSQAYIIKQWCLLCLIVQIILILSIFSSLLFLNLTTVDFSVYFKFLMAFIFYALIPLLIFRYVKHFLEKRKINHFKIRRFNKFKAQPDVFKLLLNNSKKINTPIPELGLIFENEKANFKVLKICNPYCPPCSRAHPTLEYLLKRKSISLQVIFTSIPDFDKPSSKPVFHLMALKDQNPELVQAALDFWYNLKIKNYDTLSKQYPVENIESYVEEVKFMYDWCRNNDISSTPTIILNNSELPHLYTVNDLLTLLE